MKGHLGFRCQPCFLPGPPTNLRQVGSGNVGVSLTSTLAWDAPESLGSGPILGYRVEQAIGSPASWQVVSETSASVMQALLSFCDSGLFRVSAINRCGIGASAEFYNWVFYYLGYYGSIVTESATLQPPCWATSVKVWCVGNGGTFSEGGAGGGLAWKTWTRTSVQSWQTLTAYIQNAPIPGGLSPRASVTYGSESVVAFGASTTNVGYGSGGDGWVAGNPGGQKGTITYPFTGAQQYSGNYTFGGAIGGPIGNNQDGSSAYPSPVTPCMRHPATSRSGLFDAVSLLGMKVTEDCDAEPAFGSGGVAIPYSTYGSSAIYFAPGYGGGGFDSSCPGGPGCIVVKYS